MELVRLPPALPLQGPAALEPDPAAAGTANHMIQDMAALPPRGGDGAAPPEKPAPSETGSSWRAPENWVTAVTLRAAGVLADPRSDQARQVLALVSGPDRDDQICALEAMEQVRASKDGFRPDRLMPHARKNAVRSGDSIEAPAAALRSGGLWYEIAFRCHLNAASGTIAGLDYVLGPPIPSSQWEDLGLAAVH